MNHGLPCRLRLRALLLLTRAHLVEFLREPGVLFWAFGFPILLSAALGMAFLSPRAVRTVLIVAKADSVAVRIALPDSASIALVALEGDDALRVLRRGEAAGMVRLARDGIRLSLDTTSQEGAMARLLVERSAARGLLASVRVQEPPARAGSYADFLLPGMLGLGLMNGCIWGIGFALMDLRLRKLLRLFASTPLSRADILLSVVLARGAILPLENSFLWGFGALVFGVAMHGSWLLFLASAAAGCAAFAGLGVFGASRVGHMQAAYGIVNALTIPMTILSGVFFSWTRFPHWLQRVVEFLPLTLLCDSLRAVSSEGAGFAQVAPKLALLLAWGAMTGIVGLKIFRWR
jgi:ABC-2 type transport system permease protein